METKILHLLELNDDKMGIINVLKEETEDKRIEFYVDYQDYEGIERLVRECKTLNEFEDKIVDSYFDAEGYELQEIMDQVVKKIKTVYTGYDDLSDDLYEYIKGYIYDNVPVEYPFNEYLNHLIRVNMFVTFENSTDAETDELDYKTLKHVLTKLNYVHPMTIIKELKSGEYDKEDSFLRSLREEIINAYPTQFNYLTFIGEITIREYYKILENPLGTKIKFTYDNYGGFVDPYNGGGSVLGINLPKDKPLTCQGRNVHKLLIEDSGDKYTVNAIYGLTSKCFQRIEVK